MAKTTGVHSIAMRIAVIVIVVLGIGELVARINSELWPYVPPWVERLNALPFYAIWAIVALAYRAGWPEHAPSEWRVRISELVTRDRLVVGVVGALALSMYVGPIAAVLTVFAGRSAWT